MRVIASLLLVAVCAAAMVAGQAGWTNVPFQNCGNSGDQAQVQQLLANPYPIVPGSPASLRVIGKLGETVTAGQYAVKVILFGVPIYNTGGNLCTLDPNFPCPFPVGNLNLTDTLSIPSIAPAGTYTVQVSATDQSSKELFCISLNATISVHPKLGLDEAPAQTQDMIDYINSIKTTWVAGFNTRFNNNTLGHVRGLCGTFWERRFPQKHDTTYIRLDIPDSFDARQQWPQCASLRDVRDQGACGSCWAVSAAETFTDRVCIASNGTKTPYLSSEDPTSCCQDSYGCQGGFPSAAWQYFVDTGCVTGGPWNSNQGCYPYQIAACDHHVKGNLPPCGDIGNTPQCAGSCTNSQYGLSWSADKHYALSGYSVPSDVASIQKEIMLYGPVQAAFSVYADFVTYKSGVYQHVTGDFLGGHAVKILGWGVEDDTPYWLVANSWNSDWGSQGYFKILRGQDECGIEDQIVAGHVSP